jgi:hypothetical protein
MTKWLVIPPGQPITCPNCGASLTMYAHPQATTYIRVVGREEGPWASEVTGFTHLHTLKRCRRILEFRSESSMEQRKAA